MKPKCPVCNSLALSNGHTLGKYEIATCTDCTLRFAPEAFDAAVDYEELYESPEYIETQVVPLATEPDFTYKAFFDNMPRMTAATLLDMGCGVGRFCQAAHQFGWKVTGADVSEKALQIGQRHASFPLIRVSLDELLSNERYDVVTAFEVLEHQPNPLDYLKKLKELATENGHVFCTVPNWECGSVQSATRPDWIPPVHLCFFTVRALQRLGQLAGFALVKTGIIWTDPTPKKVRALMKWSWRRFRRVPREPLGLWLKAQKLNG
jgi:SAM-dependent methyltransferase